MRFFLVKEATNINLSDIFLRYLHRLENVHILISLPKLLLPFVQGLGPFPSGKVEYDGDPLIPWGGLWKLYQEGLAWLVALWAVRVGVVYWGENNLGFVFFFWRKVTVAFWKGEYFLCLCFVCCCSPRN